MGLLDPQGPSRAFRTARRAIRSIGTQPGDLRSSSRFFTLRAGLSVAGIALLVTGCRNEPPMPAAASNEVFAARPGEGPSQREFVDDRWASIVLDEAQRAAVRTILEDAAAGPVDPMVPARYGIRFEDAPRAMVMSAPMVEMAILDAHHDPSTASVTYLDSRGRQATASVRLRKRGPVASVAYRVPGDDVVRERAAQLIDLDDRLSMASRQVGKMITASAAEAIIRASVRSNRGRIVSSGVEPERFRFNLLMLDGQEAVLTVRRQPVPRVLSVEAEAGLFGDDVRTESLERAFLESLRAWGRTTRPEVPYAGDPAPEPPAESVGQE